MPSLLVASLLVLLLISAASFVEPATRAKVEFPDTKTNLLDEESERNKGVYYTLKSLDVASIFFIVVHKMGLDKVLKLEGALTAFVPGNEALDSVLNEVQLALLIMSRPSTAQSKHKTI